VAITSIKTGSSFTNLIKHENFLAGNTAFSPTSYASISTVTVGGAGATDITFSSIPADYTHLQIRYIARGTSDSETSNGGMFIKFNSNFLTASHRYSGNGATMTADGSSGGLTNGTSQAFITGSSAGASIYGVGIIDILDYANTNKNKTLRIFNGNDTNGAGRVALNGGFRNNTDAITSILIGKKDGIGGFAEYSQFALYGIKGSL
jgi:hypothetical protein